MWDQLKDGFTQIFEFFGAIIDFIIDFVADLVNVVKNTAVAVSEIPSYFDWLPPEVLVIIVSIFSVVVIYKVLGRE